MILTLLRDPDFTADGTFGTLTCGKLVLRTVEDDRKHNQRRESCIPPGTYILRRAWYNHGHYEVFQICDVPNREHILIHIANTEEDVMGCVGVGLRDGVLRVQDEDDPAHPWVSKKAVVNSGPAFHRFMETMAHVDVAQLTIVDPPWEVS